MTLPNITKSPAPTKKTYKCGVTMNKREAHKLSQMFNPQTRPAHIPTSRRVKWRLVKKWFNRYEKQTLIGGTVIAVAKNDVTIRGWVARDKSKHITCGLHVFTHEPPKRREIMADWSGLMGCHLILDPSLFPEITWESDPVEVELTIKKISNENQD